MPATLHCAALLGATALPASVQVDLALGLPGFFLVGLPDAACIDARVRVATAVRIGAHRQVLLHRQLRKDTAALGHHDQSLARQDMHGCAADIVAGIAHYAAARRNQPGAAADVDDDGGWQLTLHSRRAARRGLRASCHPTWRHGSGVGRGTRWRSRRGEGRAPR